ncbi:MAG TPA: HAD family hydrolase [Gemmatimonadales bacterium]|nr:HAD family hydrolase [Gemmatimonadales bacterium]
MMSAVLFDFGGTLDADGRRWSERFHRGYRTRGGELGPHTFEAFFRASDRLLLERSGVSEFGFHELVWTQVRLLQGLVPDASSVDPVAWTEDFVSESRDVALRNLPLLTDLGRRFELGVISNFTGNLRPCLRDLGIEGCFSVVFDSGVVGVRKPDRRLFQAAFDALGLPPEECWMVGDNPLSDIAPAASLGCLTCWLAPPERPPSAITPTRRIATLSELTTVLA